MTLVGSYPTFSALPASPEGYIGGLNLCSTICHDILTHIMPPFSKSRAPYAARTFLHHAKSATAMKQTLFQAAKFLILLEGEGSLLAVDRVRKGTIAYPSLFSSINVTSGAIPTRPGNPSTPIPLFTCMNCSPS
jgi:hypothetical protein